jgi:predicted double-glycine peptidase
MRAAKRIRSSMTTLLVSLALLTAAGVGLRAGELDYSLGGVSYRVPVVSLREARFQTIILQKYDYSCGSAALASLLTFHYGRPTTEEAVFKAMFAAGDQQKIQREGFSLLDMKTYLAQLDLVADGFKVGLDRIAELGVPVITLINTGGYRHFVIIKGMDADEIVLGDPAQGVIIVKKEQFKPVWSGVALIIRNEASRGRENFNLQRDWRVRQKAPFGTALTRDSLANFTLLSSFEPNRIF